MLLHLGFHSKVVSIILTLQERLVCSMKYEVRCVVLVSLLNILRERCGFKRRKEGTCDLMTCGTVFSPDIILCG